jgi:hypothetical protein
MSIFKHYKAINELVHGDDLEDYDAPVKIILPDGTEVAVTDVELETNPETDEQIVWLKGVIEE